MKYMLSKLFGPNWRSSTSGIVTVIAVTTAFVIHSDNNIIAFLPDKIEEYVAGFSKLIAVVSGVIFALSVKDSHVTGGNIPQTTEAAKRLHIRTNDLDESAGYNLPQNIWPPKKNGKNKK
jgi:hypothetical protein